jgi:DNA-binding CsgD family transcriptional regulator
MPASDIRYQRWLDLTGSLLQGLDAFPFERLVRELADTFGAVNGAWNYQDADGPQAHLWPERFLSEQAISEWARSSMAHHPLLLWFSATPDIGPQTIARVPRSIVDARTVSAWNELAQPHGFRDQLSIPLYIGPLGHRAFVIARHPEDHDFGEDDLLFARELQPVLVGLERQAAVLRQWQARAQASHQQQANLAECGLTGRELAVLSLLAEGLTAESIARRLKVSPRTVTKHLEHTYAKLRVRDRLSAVLRAQRLGLI